MRILPVPVVLSLVGLLTSCDLTETDSTTVRTDQSLPNIDQDDVDVDEEVEDDGVVVEEPSGCDASAVFVRNNCVSCHSDSPDLTGGGVDLMSGDLALRLIGHPSQNPTCPDEVLIDIEEPGASMLLRTIAPDRYAGFGDPSCVPSPMPLTGEPVSDADVACIEDWISDLEEPVIEDAEVPIPASPFTVLTKLKYVLNGDVVTTDELDAITATDGSIDQEGLKGVIEAWMKTPEYRAKRRSFLRLSLQQSPADTDYFYQLRNTHVASTRGIVRNMRDSAVRTAERIIDNNEDFRTIVTTNEWEVTTLMLLVLKMTDNGVQTNRNRKNYPGNDIKYLLSIDETGWKPKGDDISDWRTVTLIHDDSSTDHLDPYEFEEPEFPNYLRSIPDGGSITLRAPRVGYFTQPAFFQTWLTNPDNQFRVTLNQTMLIALGKTFTPGDTTERYEGDAAIDLDVFPHGSECYGCHKNMEGMIAPFQREYDPLYTREPKNPIDPPGAEFSFQGYNESIYTLQDFAEATINHPGFAEAWVLKLCQWGNSAACDPNHPTVDALAADFEASGFNFSALIPALFSSDLFTMTSDREQTTVPSAIVTIARYDHYCTAVHQRLDRIVALQERGHKSSGDL
ncbi:MAG: hypothetical protein AAFV53_15950, partial [Myxococcota bacterium]